MMNEQSNAMRKVTTLFSPPPRIMFLLDWLPKLQLKLFNSTMPSNGKVSAVDRQIHVKVLLHDRLSFE